MAEEITGKHYSTLLHSKNSNALLLYTPKVMAEWIAGKQYFTLL